MDYDQFVEYVTQAGVFGVALDQHDLANPYTLAAVRSGYEHTDALGRTPTVDAAAVRGALAGVYHDDVLTHEVVDSNPRVIVEALEAVRSRPEWGTGMTVAPPLVVFYAGNLYRCVQSHTTQIDWPPDVTPALWTKYYEPTEVPAWVQPTGAQDAWPLDARVTHNGHTWRSLIPANVWEPGSVGAEALWECEDCEPQSEAWAVGVAYTGDNTAGAGNGDVVTYNGRRYRCLQSHTSIVTWTPAVVPALWLDLGPVP